MAAEGLVANPGRFSKLPRLFGRPADGFRRRFQHEDRLSPSRHRPRATGTSSMPRARRSAAWLRSSRIACRASTRPTTRPHVDMGDHIVVVNAEKIRVTGHKLKDKIYHHHTGYDRRHQVASRSSKLLKEHPERAIEIAVKGMLPKNTLGRQMFRSCSVRGRQAPAHRPAAQAAGVLIHTELQEHTDASEHQLRHRPPQDLHGPRLPASPAPARSRSTTVRSTSSSAARPAA